MRILRAAPTAATQERFQLDFFFEPGAWEGYFDRFEVWRSRGTDMGPYEALHDDAWLPARLPLNTPDDPPAPPQTGPSIPLADKTIQFLINEYIPVNITFAGPDPVSFGAAAAQIQAGSNGLLTAFVSNAVLIVQTVEPGLKASLRCVGGDAAPLLGFATTEPGSLAFGRDARVVLRRGVPQYSVIDPNGSPAYFYKARFYDSFNRTVSQFSAPFQGTQNAGLDMSSLVLGYVNLVDVTGAPIENQEVLIYNNFNGLQVGGRVVVGGTQHLLTDAAGRVELLLARGALVTVAVGGTTLALEIEIPTDPAVQTLNLLTAGNGQNELFTVQIPNIPYAVRRTL